MLLEPVLVSSQRETVPSHLAIVLDDSESMRFSDPYTDDSRAVALAADMKLESAAGQDAGRPAARDAAAGAGPGGARPAARRRSRRAGASIPTTWTRRRRRARRRRPSRASSTRSSRSGRSRRWATRSGACWPRIAASRWRASSWRPTAAPTPERTRSAPPRRPSGRTSRSTRSPPGPTRGRGTSGSPRSRSARWSSSATR